MKNTTSTKKMDALIGKEVNDMSVFANEFAYELFDRYIDWYDNWIEGFNSEPPSYLKRDAIEYYKRCAVL